MSYAKQMLDTYPRTFNVDATLLAEATDALLDCAQACTACADACMAEDDVSAMVACARPIGSVTRTRRYAASGQMSVSPFGGPTASSSTS